jgi:hypothetical protein
VVVGQDIAVARDHDARSETALARRALIARALLLAAAAELIAENRRSMSC